MMKRHFFFCLFALFAISAGFSQNGDTTLVREKYFGKPLPKVLNDFETKYGLRLKYDSALVAPYSYDWVYLGTPPVVAFEAIFRRFDNLAYYQDDAGFYCIVLKKNLPKNRTKLENKRYEGDATRQNLTVTGRIKDLTNGEFLPFATVQVEANPAIATTTNTDGYFTLYNVPSDTETLVFKYLGYETQYFHLSPEV
ncbi:MAG: carboxypeptidase-like regulatory domain-containing protein, partial [Dysgonamonadaceae bacterium]|nr:carboxypeptidase-like regulatory domain-containing protein [Dysgonamonadaceae bacterium]